jgi:hypothetical protein
MLKTFGIHNVKCILFLNLKSNVPNLNRKNDVKIV